VMQGRLSFATPLERVDTLETTDLHVGAPVLYSMNDDEVQFQPSLEDKIVRAAGRRSMFLSWISVPTSIRLSASNSWRWSSGG
jgi:hypothetical protein